MIAAFFRGSDSTGLADALAIAFFVAAFFSIRMDSLEGYAAIPFAIRPEAL